MSEVYTSKEELLNNKRRRPSIVENDVEEVEELHNYAGTVKVEFESGGRFDLPPVMYFYDFTGRDISDLTMSRQEELLNNLIYILNKRKHESHEDVDIINATPEELLEIVMNMRRQFIGRQFTHYWVCKCQEEIEAKEQVVNESLIDIDSLHFSSIEDADKQLQDFYRETFKELPKEVLNEYLKKKYPDRNINEIDIEEDIKSMKIGDNITIPNNKGEALVFEFFRLKHILKASEITEKKYSSKIKAISNRKEHNVPLAESKARKQKDIDKLKEEQAKDTLSYSRALAIISKNGQEISDIQKIEEYENLSAGAIMDYLDLLDKIKFGVDDNRKILCPLCNEVSERCLRREMDVLELLPINTTSKDNNRQSRRVNVFIGV